MMKIHRILFALLLIACAWATLGSAATEPEPYVWGNVRIGGGGFVTGIVIHPTEKDLIYIRTDVGGCYRWDAQTRTWIPLMDMFGWDESNLYGVDGFALDPNNPDVIYIAAGKYDYAQPHDVLKSEDRGVTWQKTGLGKTFGGNHKERWAGERVAVDPHNGQRVLAGTLKEGLWLSEDGAATWEQAVLPPETAEKRVMSILFDARTGKPEGTPVVYAGVREAGVFRSLDGGTTWEAMEGGPMRPHRMTFDAGGTLFVTAEDGVYRKEDDGAWLELSPEAGTSFNGLAADPMQPGRLLAARYWGGFWCRIFLTNDGGETWVQINHQRDVVQHRNLPWVPERYFASAVSSIVFDPHVPGRVWFTDWYATWMNPDINEAEWFRLVEGHEEIVTFDLISPTVGASLHSAVADVSGFRHDNIHEGPQERSGDYQDTISLDWAELKPEVLVRVGGRRGGAGFSLDGGKSWGEFENQIGEGGRIAVAADGSRIIWYPWKGLPQVSTDLGRTWVASQGAPENPVTALWDWRQPLAMDRVNPQLAYLWASGRIFSSEDGGLSWRKVGQIPNEYHVQIKTVPGAAGHLWVSMHERGLQRSLDGGTTFAAVEGVDHARLFAFGKSKAPGGPPAVFLQGSVHGKAGLYRSDDLGESWVRINPDNFMAGNNTNAMVGDRQVWGQVYIGTNGRGIHFGKPAGREP